jgi:hypothetical protein
MLKQPCFQVEKNVLAFINKLFQMSQVVHENQAFLNRLGGIYQPIRQNKPEAYLSSKAEFKERLNGFLSLLDRIQQRRNVLEQSGGAPFSSP